MREQCAECGHLSLTSPSDYFCSDVCQQHWHAKQTIGYPATAETPLPAHVATAARRWRAA